MKPFLGEIIAVDDDLADCALLEAAAQDAELPFSLKLLHGGQGLLDELQGRLRSGHAVLPRLILLDLNMPGMDGRQTLRALQSEAALASVPVMMLSTSSMKEDMESTYGLGAVSYFVKPFDYERFVSSLRTLGALLQSGTALPRILDEA